MRVPLPRKTRGYTSMLKFHGVNALSKFRAAKLLKDLKKLNPHIQSVTAEYVHFVSEQKMLSESAQKQLKILLTYGEAFNGRRSGELFLVTPRPGTISPWSSKATDIAHNSELNEVKRIERGVAYYIKASQKLDRRALMPLLYDRMTEYVFDSLVQAEVLLSESKPRPVKIVDVLRGGADALKPATVALGMAISDDEIDYLVKSYKKLKRNPTDTELMMFAQVNSEHCRHKIFNARWAINGKEQPKSLFQMIKNTYEVGGQDVITAYSDNAAVVRGPMGQLFFPDPESHMYHYNTEPVHLTAKAETHNHPTAIAPFPGAATGTGGEIRDGAAAGRGSQPKMGLSGFSVSNLNIPGAVQPWEKPYGKPNRIVSAYDIMIDGPLGATGFGNEFGRVNLAGYFRTYEQSDAGGQMWGFHKPIMLAGGVGNIRDVSVKKLRLPIGAKIIVLGGPAMLIGLGGASGASMNAGESHEDLDFASVQRGSAEMQRRAQEVINTLVAYGAKNPILSIHDVGGGGWSTALSEFAHDSGRGARFELRDLPNADLGMSPMEIWSAEAQERYVMGIEAKDLELVKAICDREHCPFAIVGETTQEKRLVLSDRHFRNKPIDLPLSVLFGKPPKMMRQVQRHKVATEPLELNKVKIDEAVKRVLHLPAVGSKKFLITIGDRTVGGLSVRDQMVGPWQVPVADVAVTMSGFGSKTGEAMALGERPPIALINAPASGRMAVGESITNIAATSIGKLSDVKLSANWMAAAGFGQQDERLFDTVKAVGEEFCPALGVTIPVGKDSLSMRTMWQDGGVDKSVVGPLALIVTAFAPVRDVELTLTPQLRKEIPSELILIDLGEGKNRLGGSALAQVYNQIGDETPDADPRLLKKFFVIVQKLNRSGKLLAYHDRSDGGLFATLAEMAFASRSGLAINLPSGDAMAQLFSEELGAVLQVRAGDVPEVYETLRKLFGNHVHRIGQLTKKQVVVIKQGNKTVYHKSRDVLEQWWAKTSYLMQAARDNATSAKQEYTAIADDKDPGLSPVVSFTLSDHRYADRPKVAIFREQGVNGQVEMAAAFERAGFTAVDVHLNDLMTSKQSLADFAGLAACGGFSYGDVLGGGGGWAKSILFHDKLRRQFKDFFAKPNTFTLGVCNGCQMLASLKELIPGAENWPRFLRNESEQFEARLVTVSVGKSPSIFFKGMQKSRLLVPVAHGEGRAVFDSSRAAAHALKPLHYVDNNGRAAQTYPHNPNGAEHAVAGLTTLDGRVTILMPHPERAFLTSQYSWHPDNWGVDGPWLKMFQNAREWVEANKDNTLGDL